MKKFERSLLGGLILAMMITACQRNVKDKATFSDEPTVANKQAPSGTCNPNAYTVTLESKTFVDGNWEWVWSIRNPHPGNGKDGTTAQDLSHWGMQFGPCVVWASVVGAATSSDGVNWNSFSPSYENDPSQGCVTTPVLKFDVGTSGTAKTYCRLTLNTDYPIGSTFGYYKSGSRTGCCTFGFNGPGCEEIPPEK